MFYLIIILMLLALDVIDYIISTANKCLAKPTVKPRHRFHKLTTWHNRKQCLDATFLQIKVAVCYDRSWQLWSLWHAFHFHPLIFNHNRPQPCYIPSTSPLNHWKDMVAQQCLTRIDCSFCSLRKQTTWALAKQPLSNKRRNSILMMCHYPDLGSASDWLKCEGISFQPIRTTTLIWVVTHHQYGISALVTQMSFWEGSSGDLAKRRLFSQATAFVEVV